MKCGPPHTGWINSFSLMITVKYWQKNMLNIISIAETSALSVLSNVWGCICRTWNFQLGLSSLYENSLRSKTPSLTPWKALSIYWSLKRSIVKENFNLEISLSLVLKLDVVYHTNWVIRARFLWVTCRFDCDGFPL